MSVFLRGCSLQLQPWRRGPGRTRPPRMRAVRPRRNLHSNFASTSSAGYFFFSFFIFCTRRQSFSLLRHLPIKEGGRVVYMSNPFNRFNAWLNSTPLAASARNFAYSSANQFLTDKEKELVPLPDYDPNSISGHLGSAFGQLTTPYVNAISNSIDRLQGTVNHVSSSVLSGLSSARAAAQAATTTNQVASSGSVPVSAGNGQAVSVPTYTNAALAQAYGMDPSTAYQEALSNTSYQRAVADLRAAGLNPALLASSASPAGGVYGASVAGTGVSTGASSAAAAHANYKRLSNIGSIIGALAGGALGGSRGAYYGSRTGSGIGGALGNLLDL